jgi:hypothetical protein
MQNTKQKKKVSYDDILASLKMSVNGNGKLEIVRTDADETKLKDQLVQKYSKPIKPNNSRPGPLQHQQSPNRSNAAKPQFNRPVTRTPIKPMPQSFIHAPTPPNFYHTPPTPPPTLNKTKANYLASYFSKEKDVENKDREEEENKDREEEEIKEEVTEVKLKIVELDEEQELKEEVELTEEEKQELEEQYEQYRENYRQQQEYNKAVILHKINQHNERVMIRQSKSKKLLFATSHIRISPSPMNSLFNMK